MQEEDWVMTPRQVIRALAGGPDDEALRWLFQPWLATSMTAGDPVMSVRATRAETLWLPQEG
jgi:hypothetical protein